jgi:hypothetical protein
MSDAYTQPEKNRIVVRKNSVSSSSAAYTPMEHHEVVVTNIQMPFWSMVWFMVKWSIASIPAFIILVIIFWLSFSFLAGCGLVLMNRLQ